MNVQLRFAHSLALALGLIVSAASLEASQPREFRNWPAGASPREVGKRVAERFVVYGKAQQDDRDLPCDLYLVRCIDIRAVSWRRRPVGAFGATVQCRVHARHHDVRGRKAARGLLGFRHHSPADLHCIKRAAIPDDWHHDCKPSMGIADLGRPEPRNPLLDR